MKRSYTHQLDPRGPSPQVRPVFATYSGADSLRYLYISMSPDEEGILTVLIVRGGATLAGGPALPEAQLRLRKVAPELVSGQFSMTLLQQ